MVQDIYALTKDDAWLARAVEGLEIEYAFWMRERITPIGLNQYGCNAETED
jgi:alpha,alpha-trehalase